MENKNFEYIYDTIFKEFYKKEFDTTTHEGKPILFKNEILSILENFYQDLLKIKNLKLDMNDYSKYYERKQDMLIKYVREIQPYSSTPLNIDLFPKSLYHYYELTSSYIHSTYKIDEIKILEALNSVYYFVFQHTRDKKLKKTKTVQVELESELNFLCNYFSDMEIRNKEWQIHCKENPNLTIKELLKSFDY